MAAPTRDVGKGEDERTVGVDSSPLFARETFFPCRAGFVTIPCARLRLCTLLKAAAVDCAKMLTGEGTDRIKGMISSDDFGKTTRPNPLGVDTLGFFVEGKTRFVVVFVPRGSCFLDRFSGSSCSTRVQTPESAAFRVVSRDDFCVDLTLRSIG